jgi:hypothetical protein
MVWHRWLPNIDFLDSKCSGWHDLGVWVQGGGIQPGYEASLSFNGKEYPSNPTVPPAQPLAKKVSGKLSCPVLPLESRYTCLWRIDTAAVETIRAAKRGATKNANTG